MVMAVDKTTEKVIGLAVFALILTALVPIALDAFTNLSSSGIGLATIFGGTLIAVLFGVFALRTVLKTLK